MLHSFIIVEIQDLYKFIEETKLKLRASAKSNLLNKFMLKHNISKT